MSSRPRVPSAVPGQPADFYSVFQHAPELGQELEVVLVAEHRSQDPRGRSGAAERGG